MLIEVKKVDPDKCSAIEDFEGNILIKYCSANSVGTYPVLRIDSPHVAHALREVVNKGVDIYFGNKKKGL